jgi:hypothetical protein
MKVQDVDVVGAQAPEARLDRLHDPLARLSLFVRTWRGRIAELRRNHPAIATLGDRAADDFFRAAGVIDVSRVDEVDALIESLVDDAFRSGFVGFAAEHHRAQAQGRNLEGAAAQISVFHVVFLLINERCSRHRRRARDRLRNSRLGCTTRARPRRSHRTVRAGRWAAPS